MYYTPNYEVEPVPGYFAPNQYQHFMNPVPYWDDGQVVINDGLPTDPKKRKSEEKARDEKEVIKIEDEKEEEEKHKKEAKQTKESDKTRETDTKKGVNQSQAGTQTPSETSHRSDPRSFDTKYPFAVPQNHFNHYAHPAHPVRYGPIPYMDAHVQMPRHDIPPSPYVQTPQHPNTPVHPAHYTHMHAGGYALGFNPAQPKH